MPLTDATHDLESRTITITADFAAPVERVWQVYADPRQLERIWGPPSHPATFVDHDLTPGGRMNYFMTGPDGEEGGESGEGQAIAGEHQEAFAELGVTFAERHPQQQPGR